MKRIFIVFAVLMVACGPRVGDKDKSSNGSPNGTPNNVNGDPNGQTNSANIQVNGDPNVQPNGDPNGDPNANPNGDPNANPNGDPNANPNGDPNANPNGDPNIDPNVNPNNMVDPVIAQKCQTTCDLLWGTCPDTRCNIDPDVQPILDDILNGCLGTGGDAGELCTARYASEPDYRDLVDEISAAGSCDTDLLREARCLDFGTDVCQGCPVPDLGGPCTDDTDCDGGLLNGYCLNDPTDWPGGMCAAGGCSTDASNGDGTFVVGGGTGCGLDGACYKIDATGSVCFDRCTTNSDCSRGVNGPNQTGYACTLIGNIGDSNGSTELLGVCTGACGDAAPCSDGFVCDDNSACVFPCDFDSDCGGSEFSCTGMNAAGDTHCEYTG